MNRYKQLVIGLLLLPLTVLAEPPWHTAASADYSLLWKQLTYTELQVDPAQRPAGGDVLDPDYAKRIVIRYGVGVSAKRFREMTRETLEEAYSKAELAPAQADIDRFCAWFEAVEKGDRYRLAWWPEQGLSLSLNDRQLGVIRDPDAAAIILSVWLGRAAISESQRDDILSQWQKYLTVK